MSDDFDSSKDTGDTNESKESKESKESNDIKTTLYINWTMLVLNVFILLLLMFLIYKLSQKTSNQIDRMVLPSLLQSQAVAPKKNVGKRK